jgi:hypothetical protein
MSHSRCLSLTLLQPTRDTFLIQEVLHALRLRLSNQHLAFIIYKKSIV